MDDKLRRLMKHEGINSTRLAEILGIQASGISHIMSGRNKPSYDFLLKLLQRFPQINPDWLLLDKGPMYRDEIKKGAQNSSAAAGKTAGSNASGGGSGNATGATVARNGAGNGQSYGAAAAGSGAWGGGDVQHGSAGTAAGGLSAAGIDGQSGAVSGGLFGPDNNDIIPSGGQSGSMAHRALGGRSEPGIQSGVNLEGQVSGTAGQIGQTSRAGEVERSGYNTAQYPVSQSGGFVRSAMIERIVVFYKDKTFSEYRPE